jgi:glycosyltransferase involved in cell wall biosynthesis
MTQKNRPTLAFATMCKNEEHIIGTVLDAVAPYIDYLVVADTGSTDRTLEIVQEFMDRTGIPGEIHTDEWIAFDKNKNLMMEYVFDKTDYVLHVDSDDVLGGDFSFTNDDLGFDNYIMTMKRGTGTFKATTIYNNRLRWKFAGVAHTIIKCIDKPNYSTGDISHKGYVVCDDIGARSLDPKKYLYDAEKLQKQFWDTLVEDPDGLNNRSAFYCAQSYMDYGAMKEALQWNRLYTKLQNTWIEERFEAQMRISRCLMQLDTPVNEVIKEMEKAIAIFSDRAEPYYYLGRHLNNVGYHELAYQYLTKAKSVSLKSAQQKYVLFVINSCYDLYVNDELSVSCYWTNRIEEGVALINEIIENPVFENRKPRLLDNLNHFMNLKKRTAAAQ